AWERIVLMNPRSIARVTGAAPARARSRLSSGQTRSPQLPLKRSEARLPGQSNAPADFLEVLSVDAIEIAKGLTVWGRRTADGSPRSMRRSTSSAHSSRPCAEDLDSASRKL